jgi:hypothetical protein
MPIKGIGWELHVQRTGLQRSGSKERTYGAYQAYQDGNPLPGLSGNICECIGPGENNVADSGLRIEQGRYPLSTQFGRYRTIGYSQDTTTPGTPPMPAVLVGSTGNRSGILIHPGHPPELYLSSIGCLNPTKPIGSGNLIDFWDSRTRVIALIDDLKRFYPAAFTANQDTDISNASVVIDGEPMNVLPDVPAGASMLTAALASFPASGNFVSIASTADAVAGGTGADTAYVVTDATIDVATRQLGAKPLFWGRYFKDRGNPDGAQYKGARENATLRAHNIPVLPIARQTNHVVGSGQLGRTDGGKNVAALIEAFGEAYLRNLGKRVLVFLDVEPSHPVSADYYFGWASEIVGYSTPPVFAPALYGNKNSPATWVGLSAAMRRGAECHGLWIAHYTGCAAGKAWSEQDAVPAGIDCPVLAWQYAENCASVDLNVINPAYRQQLLDGLILPPAATSDLVTTMASSLDRTAATSPQDFAQALKTTLDQLASYSRSPILPNGKPYLFPDGITSLEFSASAGAGTIVKINTVASAPPQTGEPAPHATALSKLAVSEPTDTMFSTAIPISSFTGTAPSFGSLVPGGFFSSNPNDVRVRRSVRTNNPGALNISTWQKTRPGYAGVTPPDSSVNHNVTTIYRTPEHGTAAWYHLLGKVYDIGSRFTLADLARRYAGGDATQGEIDTYVSGWTKFAEGFDASKVFDVGSIDDMTSLGVAMFSHEIGKKTPLQVGQIQYGINHEMDGTLPP